MRDHFDITLERKLENSGADAPGGGSQVRRIELITGTGRRRRCLSDDKARILMESFAPGSCVSDVARCNGLSPQQLFAWRRETRALFQEYNDHPAAPSAPPPDSPPSAPHSGAIEIAIRDAAVRVVTPVDTAALIAVLRAIRRAS